MVVVLQHEGVVVAVVADGAGGTSGGAEAASCVIRRVSEAVEAGSDLLGRSTWEQVLRALDAELDGLGQTTAVVAATDGSVIVGASVGDSGALLVTMSSVRELSADQHRKPLLGSGAATPVTFRGPAAPNALLLLATDGLLKYASEDRICAQLRRPEPSLKEHCDALVELVRLPRGGLQDDVGLVLIGAAPRP